MGAAARQRGDKAIREGLSNVEYTTVQTSYVSRLEQTVINLKDDNNRMACELDKAKRLIDSLRAKNAVMVDEKAKFIETVRSTKRHISVSYNPQKKWAISLVLTRLEKARLI